MITLRLLARPLKMLKMLIKPTTIGRIRFITAYHLTESVLEGRRADISLSFSPDMRLILENQLAMMEVLKELLENAH